MGNRLIDIVMDRNEDFLYEDERAMKLTPYVMSERCLQVEIHGIFKDKEENDYDTLTFILEGGFKGFHNMEPSELIDEYAGIENTFYQLHEDGELPLSLYDEDPLTSLEQDENGEVAKASSKIIPDARDHHLINKDFKRMVGKKK